MRPAAGRGGGRHRHAGVGGGGVRHGGGLRRDRLGQPGVRRDRVSSDAVREMLAQAEQADVAMAPAADMFEMGVKVQVLKRGTMFAMRAAKLYELYRAYPASKRSPRRSAVQLEKNVFRSPARARCGGRREDFFRERDPAQVDRADADPQAQNGAGVPLVPGPVVALGERRGGRPAGSTIRCGAARRWGRSTSGRRARSWKSRAIAAWPRGGGPHVRGGPRAQATTVAFAMFRDLKFECLKSTSVWRDAQWSVTPRSAMSRGIPNSNSQTSNRFEWGRRRMASDPVQQSVPLAIVGIGCLFPRADDLGAYWANLKAGVDAVTAMPATHWRPDDYLDADPKAPDMHLRRPRRLPRPGALPAARIRHRPQQPRSDRHVAAPRPRRRQAGPRSTPAYWRLGASTAPRISVILGVTGTLELVIPLGARLGHPHLAQGVDEAGVEPRRPTTWSSASATSTSAWQENSFPGLLGNVVAGRIANRLDLRRHQLRRRCGLRQFAERRPPGGDGVADGPGRRGASPAASTRSTTSSCTCASARRRRCRRRATPGRSTRPATAPSSAKALGMVVLKRLADAERDGDRDLRGHQGLGTSSDGKGNAVYAPTSGRAGTAPCGSAYQLRRGRLRDTIELVEAHGTGTRVGDAVEVRALTEVFGSRHPVVRAASVGERASRPARRRSRLGRRKPVASPLGRSSRRSATPRRPPARPASSRRRCALYHKVLPPTIKVGKPLEALRDPTVAVLRQHREAAWLPRAEHPRRAAVSAFGFGGSNFHCVLEERRLRESRSDWDGEVRNPRLLRPDAVGPRR